MQFLCAGGGAAGRSVSVGNKIGNLVVISRMGLFPAGLMDGATAPGSLGVGRAGQSTVTTFYYDGFYTEQLGIIKLQTSPHLLCFTFSIRIFLMQ